ncbi:MAG: Calx-beta domain-containing protein, partial [Steroidobacter sp.]
MIHVQWVGTRSWAVLLVASALAGCGGGGGGNDRPSGPGQDPPPAPVGQLRFSANTLTIDEAAGTLTVTVERTGGSNGAVTVSMSTANGSATVGQDYDAFSSTVNFANGDATPKTITLRVLDDELDEPNETFAVALSNPTGGATLADAGQLTVTITDDDEVPVATTLGIGYQVKKLAFTWASAVGATFYRLMEKTPANPDFVQRGANIPATGTTARLQIPVHLFNWPPGSAATQYRLDVCNAAGCAASNIVSPESAGSALTTGYLKSLDTADQQFLGWSTAVSGDGKTVALGAFLADEGAGAVYIYSAPAPGTAPLTEPALLRQPVKLSPPVEGGAGFGSSVALSANGDFLFVGAMFESTEAIESGAVFVYRRIDGVWTLDATIKASDPGERDNFGE